MIAGFTVSLKGLAVSAALAEATGSAARRAPALAARPAARPRAQLCAARFFSAVGKGMPRASFKVKVGRPELGKKSPSHSKLRVQQKSPRPGAVFFP